MHYSDDVRYTKHSQNRSNTHSHIRNSQNNRNFHASHCLSHRYGEREHMVTTLPKYLVNTPPSKPSLQVENSVSDSIIDGLMVRVSLGVSLVLGLA